MGDLLLTAALSFIYNQWPDFWGAMFLRAQYPEFSTPTCNAFMILVHLIAGSVIVLGNLAEIAFRGIFILQAVAVFDK